MSQGGTSERFAHDAGSPVQAPPLEGLPSDFRTKLTRVGRIQRSEHQSVPAILWADEAGAGALAKRSAPPETALFVEELLGPSDGGETTESILVLAVGKSTRFAVADARGGKVYDDEGSGTSTCARCHAEAPRAPVWLTAP